MKTERAARRRNTVLAALEIARKRHPQINMKGLIAFLYVAENPGIQMVELAEVSQLALPTASRVARALCEEGVTGALPPYLGLLKLESSVNDENGARRMVLSDAGHALRAEVDRLINMALPIHEEEVLIKL